MANWEAYRAIKEAAEEIGWPEHYQTDLTHHDRIQLSRKDAPKTFLWVLRESGTHLIDLEDPLALWHALSVSRMWSEEARWFCWHAEAGGYLREITHTEFLTRIENALRGHHAMYRGEVRDAGEIVGVLDGTIVVNHPRYGGDRVLDYDQAELALSPYWPNHQHPPERPYPHPASTSR